MPDIDLTPEQETVVECPHDRLVVSASAGAGKTRVLVERYLRAVREGLSPDQILTITFTRKAAAEMRHRIVGSLRAEGREPEARAAETGPIQTLHSFCDRVLRENALAAGLDPDFGMLEEVEYERLVRSRIRAAMVEQSGRGGDAAELIAALAGREAYTWRGLEGEIAAAVRRVLDRLRGTGLRPEELGDRYESREAYRAYWRECYARSRLGGLAEAFDPSAPDWGEQLLARTLPRDAEVKALMGGPLLEEEEAAACGLMQIVGPAWRGVEAEMDRLQAFDHAEIEARAVRLIEESEQVARRLRRQIGLVLVDEAQDLNPVQYRLLRALAIGREMWVGDDQQSIYAFRQADREIFVRETRETPTLRLSKNHRSRAGILHFIDRLFADLWDDRPPMAADAREIADVELWDAGNVDKPDRAFAEVAGAVKALLSDGVLPGEVAILVRTSMYGERLSEALAVQGVPVRHQGGSRRFYARLEVRDVANALRAISDPGDDFALLCLLRGPMVGLSLDSVVLLARAARAAREDGGDEVGLIDALASFEPPTEEDQAALAEFSRWFGPLRRHGERLPAWEVIGELLRETPFLERLARREKGLDAIANVRKLLGLAAQAPLLASGEFADLVHEVREIEHREEDPELSDDDPRVTVMTIHKSKGLEFPVVVLPQTHSGRRGAKVKVFADAATGVVGTSLRADHAPIAKWLSRVESERTREEDLRLLYVAMTRARHRLCVVVDQRDNSGHAGLVASAMMPNGAALPGITVRELGSR